MKKVELVKIFNKNNKMTKIFHLINCKIKIVNSNL